MNAVRCEFLGWVECLLDPRATPGAQRAAAHAWCEWGLGLLGIDPAQTTPAQAEFARDTLLPTGKAISPLGAARCLWEYHRTAMFLQALDAAVAAAMSRFPGETIHVVEAGCGPLAPLALAARHPRDRVQVTLLDLHADALRGARHVAEALGVAEHVRAWLAADATAHRFAPTERPHVVVAEVLLRALTSEPQVAATLNLAPQVRPGGFFLPERIDVHACLFDTTLYHRPRGGEFDLAAVRAEAITELGGVFTLEAAAVERLAWLAPGQLRAGCVRVPPHDARRRPLQLFTRLQVGAAHRLEDFQCSLTLPERLAYPAAWTEQGGTAEFYYEISAAPGLRLCPAAGLTVVP